MLWIVPPVDNASVAEWSTLQSPGKQYLWTRRAIAVATSMSWGHTSVSTVRTLICHAMNGPPSGVSVAEWLTYKVQGLELYLWAAKTGWQSGGEGILNEKTHYPVRCI